MVPDETPKNVHSLKRSASIRGASFILTPYQTHKTSFYNREVTSINKTRYLANFFDLSGRSFDTDLRTSVLGKTAYSEMSDDNDRNS